jgi:hypothetical protein
MERARHVRQARLERSRHQQTTYSSTVERVEISLLCKSTALEGENSAAVKRSRQVRSDPTRRQLAISSEWLGNSRRHTMERSSSVPVIPASYQVDSRLFETNFCHADPHQRAAAPGTLLSDYHLFHLQFILELMSYAFKGIRYTRIAQIQTGLLPFILPF